jgi:glycosyltransferase involved in cell wall biosynthesis
MSAQNEKVACLTLWFPNHNNVWYEAQLAKLGQILTVYKVRLSGNRVLRAIQFRLWTRLKRRIIYPLVLRYLSRRHEMLFTLDVEQIPGWPKHNSVVVDIDDAVFSLSEVRLLNLPQVKNIIVITDKAKAVFESLGVVQPISVVPKGVLLEQIDAAKVTEIGNRFKRKTDVVVGYVAPTLTLSSDGLRRAREGMDDLDLLLASAKQARTKEPRIKLWLIGEPSQSVKNYAAAEPWITLFGYVSSSNVLNYVSNFEIGVYPRKAHVPPGRISVKIVQYMACGVPIVSTDVDEANIIQETRCGFVCGSAEEFTEALVKLAQSSAMRAEFGGAGLSYAQAKLDWSVLAPVYEKILRQ